MTRNRTPSLEGRFLDALAEMLEADVPVGDAVMAALGEVQQDASRAILSEVAAEVRAGAPLSVALYGAVFPVELIAVIAAAERENTLPSALEMLARDNELRAQGPLPLSGDWSPDLSYSVTVFFLLAAVTSMYLMFVFPQVRATYDSFGASLPRFSLLVFNYLTPVWLWVLGLGVGFWVIGRSLARRSPRVADLRDRTLMRIPGAAAHNRRLLTSRMVLLLAAAAECRIPYPLALAYLRTALEPGESGDTLARIERDLVADAPAAETFEKVGGLPRRLALIAARAQRSERAARVFSRVAEGVVDHVTQAAEGMRRTATMFLYLLAVTLVAASVIAMYLPIFTIGSTM